MKSYPLSAIALTTLAVFSAVLPTASGNDNFANAAVLTGYDTEDFVADLSGFGFEVGEPSHLQFSGEAARKTAWWKWTAPESGFCTIDTRRTINASTPVSEVTFGVYTGNAVNALTPILKSSYTSLNGNNLLAYGKGTFYAQQGQVYSIALDGSMLTSVNAVNRKTVIVELQLLTVKKESRTGVIFLGDEPELQGIVKARRTVKGGYSAAVTMGGKTVRFRGVLNSSGEALVAIPRAALGDGIPRPAFTVLLGFAGHGRILVTDNVTNTDYFSFPAMLPFTSQNPSTVAGRYTHNLYANLPASGGGYGTISVTTRGLARGVMTLPDGLAAPWSSPLHQDGSDFSVFIYKSTFKNKGYLTVEAGFSEGGEVDRFYTSDATYFRPAGAGNPAFYAFGLDLPEFYMEGGTYKAPAANNRVLGFLNAQNGVGKLRVFEAPTENINADTDEPVNFGTTNLFVFADAITRKPRLKVNKTNGTVSGEITLPAGVVRKIAGVIYQYFGDTYLVGSASGATQRVPITVIP
jgi:hypothetical protein